MGVLSGSEELREERPGLSRYPGGIAPLHGVVVADKDAGPHGIAGVAALEVDAGGGQAAAISGRGHVLRRAAVHTREFVDLRNAVLRVSANAVSCSMGHEVGNWPVVTWRGSTHIAT